MTLVKRLATGTALGIGVLGLGFAATPAAATVQAESCTISVTCDTTGRCSVTVTCPLAE